MAATKKNLNISNFESLLQLLESGTVNGVLYDSNAPASSKGKVGDVCITPYAIYQKQESSGNAGIELSGTGTFLDGRWEDQGLDITGTQSGLSSTWKVYKHVSGNYVLRWSTAYGGYWWINSITNPTADDGASFVYRSDSVPPTADITLPPSGNWNGGSSNGYMGEMISNVSTLTFNWVFVAGAPGSVPVISWKRIFNIHNTADGKTYLNNKQIAHLEEVVTKTHHKLNTSQTDTGKLFTDNKIVYRRVLTGTTHAVSGTQTLLACAAVDNLVSLEAFAIASDNTVIPNGWYDPDTGERFAVRLNSNKTQLAIVAKNADSGRTLNSRSYRVIMEYTV